MKIAVIVIVTIVVRLAQSTNEHVRSRLKRNGLLVPFRKELARIILSNRHTKNVHNGKIATESGLHFLNKGRKAATEITST